MDNFKKDTTSMTKIVALFLMLVLSILGAVRCCAQNWSAKKGVGGVLPIERAFAALEVRKQIAPRYAIGMAGEVSMIESNVMPKMAVGLISGLSIEAGFGWGHHWKKANCNDHNFHTYVVGVTWEKPIGKRVSFFMGPSMFWRSYQAHIGLHRGTLRINTGFTYRL